jgi:hypothetical protein
MYHKRTWKVYWFDFWLTERKLEALTTYDAEPLSNTRQNVNRG